MKILFYDIDNFEIDYLLENISKNIMPYYFSFSLTENTIIDSSYANCEAVCVFINSYLSKTTLKKFKNLKYIFTRSTGVSHIDTEYCKNNNIQVYNVPAYGSTTVGEYVFALIFALSRKIVKSKISVASGEITKCDLQGIELKGKTIGIVGAGNIGLNVAKIASCLQMNVIAYDIKQDNNIKYTDLTALLKESDFVAITCPLTDETRKLINKNNIFNMKKNAFLINVARGEIVETEALYQALADKKIQGAALDTIECEEMLCELYGKCKINEDLRNKCIKKYLFAKKLVAMDNVIITPHNAYNTKEARIKILDGTLNNINSMFN